MTDLPRCPWCGTDPEYIAYHDQEWGVPVHDDQRLFEMLILEGAQAGLSWITVLRKRARYRELFADFDPAKVARFTQAKVEKILLDPGIIRNRLKVESTISNAKALLAVQQEFGNFNDYLWRFVDFQPQQNWLTPGDPVPTTSPLAEVISKDLKKRGFRFVGPTIIYAYMQAVGLLNDHFTHCFRHRQLAET